MWGMNLHCSVVGCGGDCQLAQTLASAAGMFSLVDGVGGTSDGVGGTSEVGGTSGGVGGTSDGVDVVACAVSWDVWSAVSHSLVVSFQCLHVGCLHVAKLFQ